MNQKLDIGNVLTRTFETYRDQFTLLIPAALVLFIPVALINALLLSAGGFLLAILAAFIGLLAGFWFQGMIVKAVEDIMDGRRDHTVGSLLSSVSPVIWPLVATGILATIGLAIGFLLLIIPFFILLTLWAVLIPVVVLERPGVIDSFGRSQALVKGNALPVFGVIVVVFLIVIVISAVLQGILLAISDSFVGAFIADLVARVLVTPIWAIAAAVLYFELKRLHGGSLDAAGAPAGVGTGAPSSTPAPPAEAPTQTQPAPQQPPGPESPGPQSPQSPGPQSPGPGSPPPGGSERPPGA